MIILSDQTPRGAVCEAKRLHSVMFVVLAETGCMAAVPTVHFSRVKPSEIWHVEVRVFQAQLSTVCYNQVTQDTASI